ncbi:TetR/AcrR family transcriptional regulator [Solwaraspora sp. WMMD1047]|uniref:TetR/AcrR family transcriptional regulator n=1 Tax=Solwaraspora sp. WMMD1047 TaxID=3016102 RepID=UPI002417650B|nr:TetR/AcrR family transcriptional regulator [Solwaraspora sp. WMMD1047]MDG4829194.1 TetR/AcrR family transcriptional regulator [Solwaraspora sp. WMMD1047]
MSQPRSVVDESGSRARTRRAILDAAIAVLSRDQSASLAEIAVEASVGRTTLHRYFPERSDLMAALGSHILDRVAGATDQARLTSGTAIEAMERVCREYFELGETLLLAFNDPQVTAGQQWQQDTECDLALLDLVKRGHADGTIDPAMDPRWARETLWCLLYAAWQHTTENGVARYDALDLCVRTLRKALAPGGR